MRKLLIIIDPQNDFITGTLAVEGAEEAMQELVSHMVWNQDEIEGIIVSCDNHPFDHCSFKNNGGTWPTHCVNFTWGAAIKQSICSQLNEFNRKDVPIWFFPKGEDASSEEYGAFEDPSYINKIIKSIDPEEIEIAGLAGDYCVKESILQLIEEGHNSKLVILRDCIASIDGGNTLYNLIVDYDLSQLYNL